MKMSNQAGLRDGQSVEQIGTATLTEMSGFATPFAEPGINAQLQIEWATKVPVTVSIRLPQGSTPQYLESDIILDAAVEVGWGHRYSGTEFARLTPESRLVRNEYWGSFKATVSTKILDWLEIKRAGGDIELHINLTLVCLRSARLVLPAQSMTGVAQLVGQSDLIQVAGGRWEEVTIPGSAWAHDFLQNMGYHGPQHFELPPLPDLVFAPSVRRHMEDASRYLQLGGGNLRAVPGACLNALDALAKSLHYRGFGDIPDITQGTFVERKKLMQALKDYLNRWRHDNTPSGGQEETLPPITREEAAFVYLGTAHLLAFLGQNLPVRSENALDG